MEHKTVWQERMDERKKERARLFPSNVVVAFIYMFVWTAYEKQAPSWEKFLGAIAALTVGSVVLGLISTLIMETNRERIDALMNRKLWVKAAVIATVVILCSAIVTFI